MEDSGAYIRQSNAMSTTILVMDGVFLIFVCALAFCVNKSHSHYSHSYSDDHYTKTTTVYEPLAPAHADQPNSDFTGY